MKSRLLCLLAIMSLTLSVAHAQPTAQQALTRLQQGNTRYAKGKNTALRRATDRPQALNSSQLPFAMILGCADSRVAPELAFDQPWGSLFTVRVAGNIADPSLVGSLEYAVLTFHTPLIVVLGHDQCGAVDAALKKAPVTGNLKRVIDDILPAVVGAHSLDAAIDANVHHSMAQLVATSPVIAKAVKAGQVHIVGGVYSFKSGTVRWLKQ
jgi:carbonic anhydrase